MTKSNFETARPLRHLILTVGERATDGGGLWPADFDLLTRAPLLERVDIIATHATIAAGLFDRLQKFMPGFEEADVPADDAPKTEEPKTEVPADEAPKSE